jgi:hypothetical protein
VAKKKVHDPGWNRTPVVQRAGIHFTAKEKLITVKGLPIALEVRFSVSQSKSSGF